MSKMILAVAAVALAVGASAVCGAGLYKCTDANGKTTFSQFQCAPDAAPIALDMTRPTPAQIQQARDNEARALATIDAKIAARQQARAEIAQREKIAALQAARDAKVRRNEIRSSYANNNLAGATYRNALAEESGVAVDQFNSEIEASRKDLDRVRGE